MTEERRLCIKRATSLHLAVAALCRVCTLGELYDILVVKRNQPTPNLHQPAPFIQWYSVHLGTRTNETFTRAVSFDININTAREPHIKVSDYVDIYDENGRFIDNVKLSLTNADIDAFVAGFEGIENVAKFVINH